MNLALSLPSGKEAQHEQGGEGHGDRVQSGMALGGLQQMGHGSGSSHPAVSLVCLSPTEPSFVLFMTLMAFSTVYPVISRHAPHVKHIG